MPVNSVGRPQSLAPNDSFPISVIGLEIELETGSAYEIAENSLKCSKMHHNEKPLAVR